MRMTSLAAGWLRRAARAEALPLLVGLVVVAALWVFAEVAEEVLEGDPLPFDDALFQLLRQTGEPGRPIGPAWLVEVALEVTALGSTSVLLLMLLAVLGYLALERRWRELWLVVIAAAGGATISSALKALIGRPRPAALLPFVHPDSPSFPSGHAMLAAVVYLTLGTLLARFVPRRRVKAFFVTTAMILVFLVGVTRVYLGVHYPSDVLGGWSAGLAWALVCWLVALALQRRGALKTPK
jgi:undecaprenyl-diphosphatase